MILKKTYGFNKAKAVGGVWLDYDDSTKLLIGKIGTLSYQHSIVKHSQKYQQLIRLNRQTPEMNEEIICRALADTILLDWRNLEEEEGSPLSYSKDNAYRILKDYPDFREFVLASANDISLFSDDIIDVEADAKNLPMPSSGS